MTDLHMFCVNPEDCGDRWRFRATSSFILLLVMILTLSSGCSKTVTTSPVGLVHCGDLAIPADQLDFGEIWESEDSHITAQLFNPGDRPVQVRGFERNSCCGPQKIEPEVFRLEPRQSHEIHLHFDSRSRLPIPNRAARRNYEFQLRPIVDRNSHSKSAESAWIFRGIIKSRITTDWPMIHFGDNLVRGQGFRPQRVVLRTHMPTSRIDVRSDKSRLSWEVKRIDQWTFQLQVRPHATLGSGSFESTMTISIIDENGTWSNRHQSLEAGVRESSRCA